MSPFADKPTLDKTALRTRMRVIRQELAAATPEASVRIARRAPLSRLTRFRIVASYVAQGSELDPEPLVQALLDEIPGHMQAALPVAKDRRSPLTFRLWTPGEPLERDAFNIPIPPRANAQVEPSLVITPLLAFDRMGGRLGQGAGHYDRTLANLRKARPVFVLGLAFAGQELDEIPMERHDERLDAILTETDFIEVAKGSR